MVTDRLKSGGKYAAELANGKKYSFEEIDAVGTELAEILIDPYGYWDVERCTR